MNDKVNYRNPPKQFQFKKGFSGNPKGRPKRKGLVLGDIIKKARNTFTQYKERGRMKTATRLKVVLKKLVNGALQGDASVVDFLLKLRARASKNNDAEVQRFVVEGGLPDHPGQTGEQKAREHARENESDSIVLSEQPGSSATESAESVSPTASPETSENE